MTPRRRAAGTLDGALVAALEGAPPLPRDAAAVALARQYAQLLDQRTACPECGCASPAMLSDVGPKLLAALTALGMTPAGRGAKSGPADPVVPPALQLLRDRAQARRGAAG